MAGVPAAKDEALRTGYGGSFSYFTLGPAIDEGVMLSGESLPAYRELARYVFFTATGEQLDEGQIDEASWFVGASRAHDVYLIYQPSVDFLKRTPLGFDWAQALPHSARPRLVIASFKLVDDDVLRDLGIEFCQLPFEIYRYRA